MAKEKGILMLKPGFLNCAAEVLKRLRAVPGLSIKKITSFRINEEFFLSLYGEHKEKSFFRILQDYVVEKYVIIALFEGDDGIIEKVRVIVGDTDPAKAAPGTIRHDLGEEKDIMRNVVHASANPKDGEREHALVCKEQKL